MIIELYLDSNKPNMHKIRPTVSQAQKCTANYASIKMDSQTEYHAEDIFRGLSGRDRQLVILIENLGKSNGLDIKIYDIAKFKNNIRGLFKGVRKTPTVIIGKDRFEEDFLEVRNLVALDEYIQKKILNN